MKSPAQRKISTFARWYTLSLLLAWTFHNSTGAQGLTSEQPTTGVQGTVRNTRGDGIPGVELQGAFSKTTSDSNGAYILPEPAGTVTLHHSTGGRRDYVLESVVLTIADGSITRRDLLALPVSASVSGTVHDSSGAPVANLHLYAEAIILAANFREEVETTSQGSFLLPLSWATWSIRPLDAELESRGYASVAPISIEVTDVAPKVNFTVLPPDSRIEGRVVMLEGTPVANIDLQLFQKQTGYFNRQTDSTGKFSIPVRSGACELRLDPAQANNRGILGPDLRLTIEPNQTLRDLLLIARPATHSFHGRVTDPVGGVRGASLSASTFRDNSRYLAHAVTDENGAYAMALFEGQWAVALDCLTLNYPCPPSQTVNVDDTDPTADFTLRYGEFMSFFAVNPMDDATIRLKFMGIADGTADIYYSTDLRDWTLLTTIGFSAGAAWLDVPAPDQAGFFKAISLP
jgi:hypothetical protein